MSGLEFLLELPGQKPERLLVDSDRVLIGSGAHCEIRLPPEHASVEHVLVMSAPGGLCCQARSLSPPPTMNGAAFTEAPLVANAIVGIGSVKITASVAHIGENVQAIKKKQQAISPMTYVLVLVAMP